MLGGMFPESGTGVVNLFPGCLYKRVNGFVILFGHYPCAFLQQCDSAVVV
jgi:hypothetical protein